VTGVTNTPSTFLMTDSSGRHPAFDTSSMRGSPHSFAPARAMSGVSAAISLLGDDRHGALCRQPIAAVAAKGPDTA